MTEDISQMDKVAMARTLRMEATHLLEAHIQLNNIADALDPPPVLPQHSTASHMS